MIIACSLTGKFLCAACGPLTLILEHWRTGVAIEGLVLGGVSSEESVKLFVLFVEGVRWSGVGDLRVSEQFRFGGTLGLEGQAGE